MSEVLSPFTGYNGHWMDDDKATDYKTVMPNIYSFISSPIKCLKCDNCVSFFGNKGGKSLKFKEGCIHKNINQVL